MDGIISPVDRDRSVYRAVIDSRQAGQESIFFALSGARTDGHAFVDDVIASGGCAVVSLGPEGPGRIHVRDVEKALLHAGAWRRDQLTCPVVGVSGSSGKTTTRELLKEALRGTFLTGGTCGNLNNHLGLPLSLLNLPREVEVAVLEMGMNHPGELAVLGTVARPCITIITNIGIAHMEFFSSIEDVTTAKAELIAATIEGGTAIIPVSEPILMDAARKRELEIVRIGAGGDLWLSRTRESFYIEPLGKEIELSIEGEHNYVNCLFAIAAAERLGIPIELALKRLVSYAGMPGRGRTVCASGIRIMDESYNANPDSTKACLLALADCSEDRIAVLGDMLELGVIADEMHHSILELADSLGLKFLILTGKHFASASTCLEKTPFAVSQNWMEALQALRENMSRGDTVLIKGSHSLQMSRIVESLQEED
jgi:UDP-N-acetylmuramoyl-tripeptide--D-alanyl-D-alanine ligase